MPLVIAEHTMGDWTDEEVLRHCVKEYANPSNYEPYEKDYGVGRPVMRTPMFAREPRDYAERTLQFLNQRQANRLDDLAQRPNIAAALSGLAGSDKVAMEMPVGVGKSNPRILTPMQRAYLKMYNTLKELSDNAAWEMLDIPTQDKLAAAVKDGAKWL